MLSLWCASNSFNAELNIFNQRFVPKNETNWFEIDIKGQGRIKDFPSV